MDSSTLSAVNAYRNQMKMMQDAPEETAAQTTASGASFADLVKDALQEASNAGYTADATAIESMTGKVDLTDLVTAVSNAELTLNTVIAVRDRVIGAYQDILRMSI